VRIRQLEEIEQIACVVADAWVPEIKPNSPFDILTHPSLAGTLDRLELATRASGMRKVRP
jgi:hypothetical protein